MMTINEDEMLLQSIRTKVHQVILKFMEHDIGVPLPDKGVGWIIEQLTPGEREYLLDAAIKREVETVAEWRDVREAGALLAEKLDAVGYDPAW